LLLLLLLLAELWFGSENDKNVSSDPKEDPNDEDVESVCVNDGIVGNDPNVDDAVDVVELVAGRDSVDCS
jgi:hypothetical protein